MTTLEVFGYQIVFRFDETRVSYQTIDPNASLILGFGTGVSFWYLDVGPTLRRQKLCHE